ncbi:hypothetical protein ACL2XP_03365 [Sodalis sp. RH21]|uniref:hypothetical protein n=1 Tax=unclassified Sodalis (in: enterobacteria) TaxID=2636512 RepID=UPI0039B4E0A4
MIDHHAADQRAGADSRLGVSMLTLADVLPELASGDPIRLLPNWYADAGAISLYYASRTLISSKTRVFVDYAVDAFQSQGLAERFAGSLGRRTDGFQAN